MAEKPTNRVPIKISPKTLDWLVEEQVQNWKTGKEPAQNESIREAIEIARHPEKYEFNADEAHRLLSEEARKYIQLLISVLESGWKGRITAVQQNLHKIFLTQQMAVLKSAQQKSELHAAVVIARFLGSGTALPRGHQGWDVQSARVLPSSETLQQLNELGFTRQQSDLERDDERPSKFVHDLLSNRGIERLDKISRRAFRANQNRAYFEYVDELFELYQEHSMLREGVISYPALVREKIRVTYQFARLYLAGTLHLFGISEEVRLRMAQSSFEAIGSLIG